MRSKPLEEEEESRFVTAWSRKWEENKFCCARPGDHLLMQFECDLCIFRKLKGRSPLVQSDSDRLLFSCIRRVILDSFWSRESSTVATNLATVNKTIRVLREVGLMGPCVSRGPMPNFDHCAYEVAVAMVLSSHKAGRNDKSHTQFDTIRQLRTCHANFERVSAESVFHHLSLDITSGPNKDITRIGTSTVWFRRFVTGCHSRMGQISKPNLGLTTNLILRVLEEIKKGIQEEEEK